jgi:hypothetical protein
LKAPGRNSQRIEGPDRSVVDEVVAVYDHSVIITQDKRIGAQLPKFLFVVADVLSQKGATSEFGAVK